MSDLVPVRRALISVSDKTGLADFAGALVREFGVELISTGGTAKFLRDAGLPVTDVAQITGVPEMMDGRVKTLHPKIHGAILADRDNPEHLEQMKSQGIAPIDLVCVNLYPFKKTIEKPDVTLEEAIENIDIGGPSMIRSAAKNYRFVLVVTQPTQYHEVLGELRKHNGSSRGAFRLKKSSLAFMQMSGYDLSIFTHLYLSAGPAPSETVTPPAMQKTITSELSRKQMLRYGENPHQQAALYLDDDARKKGGEASVARASQLHGKELSYINLLDADAALACVREFAEPAACIVKHASPCGAAVAGNLADAFRRAFETDPLAAFGGILALNQSIDRAAAQAITSIDKLLEVIVAPAIDETALGMLVNRWKNVRLLVVGPLGTEDPDEFHMHKIVGGYLVQQRDLAGVDESAWKVVSKRQPTQQELADLRFAWLLAKHVKSNAIVIAKDRAAVGIGGGQVDRVGAAKIAIEKAAARAAGAVAASDAFFPFPDGPQLLLDAAVTAIVHPGGSVNDQQTIDAVNAKDAVLIATGQRHFRH